MHANARPPERPPLGNLRPGKGRARPRAGRMTPSSIHAQGTVMNNPAARLLSSMFSAALLLCGCATSPTGQLKSTETAIAAAAEAGASRLAAAELASAVEKARLAQRWMAAGDYKPALWLVEQARVDAELAQVKATARAARR